MNKTTEGLRDKLFEELENLQKGNSTPQQAKAVCGIVSQITNTVRLELEYSRFVSDMRGRSDSAGQEPKSASLGNLRPLGLALSSADDKKG